MTRRRPVWPAVVAVLVLPGLLPAGAAGDEDPGGDHDWVGKSRDQVVEKWGPPDKVKKRRDGEVLIYEREVLVKFAYRGGDEASKSFSFEKDGEGKRRLREDDAAAAPEPVYRKVKFKFLLDREGRVTQFEQPEVKNVDLGSMPRADGGS